MPNIKPISDLRNYNEVLRDVTIGSPVFLTKNGRGKYATAYLSNKDDFTTFSYGDYELRFRTSKRLKKYLKVKEWDAPYGYMVVDCLHETMGVVEDYIDLLPMLDNLFIDAPKFLQPIKKVEVKNA